MEALALKAENRSDLKRTLVKKLRSGGNIPAVLYGNDLAPQAVSVQKTDLAKLIKASASQNILVQLEVSGKQHLALVQDIQRHPLSGDILHVDFRAVSENKPVIVSVPVEPKGEAYGVKNEGGLLEHVLFQTKIRALPKDLPEIIYVDVSAMRSGQTMHLGEIPLPAELEVMGNKGIPAFSISLGRAARAEAAQEKAAAAAKK
jgi:large subunit ribosomal protein L25